jgi:hypothetical protein
VKNEEYEEYEEDVEHASNELVGEENLEFWTKEWWKWFLGFPEDISPFTTVGTIDSDRYKGKQPTALQKRLLKDHGGASWFLTGPPYGGETLRVYISQGNYSILAAPYCCAASSDAFPSLKGKNQQETEDNLNEFVEHDVNGVYEWWGKLDGVSLRGSKVKIKKPFTVQVPDKNIFGIPVKKDTTIPIEIVTLGYHIWLKPLGPGDHLLHIHGYSKNYEFDVKYQLVARGP